MQDLKTSNPERARIVELVGLAGVGKTTLSRELRNRDARFSVPDDLQLRKNKHLLYFAGQFPALLPYLIYPDRSSRNFNWQEIKTLAYLRSWPQFLQKNLVDKAKVILLDHGPIFKLATLNAFGPEKMRLPAFEGWWRKIYSLWAHTLHMVLWLDAPENILIERINSRTQIHAVKGKPAQEAAIFLSRYRAGYDITLEKLSEFGVIPIHHFDTSRASVDQVVEEILKISALKLDKS